MIRSSVSKLQKRENDLYRRVEDLRYELYLHHHSPLFQIYKMHKEVAEDITSLFKKRAKKLPIRSTHLSTIHSLEKRLRLLTLLSHSPYMSFIRFLRQSKWTILNMYYRLRFLGKQTIIKTNDKTIYFVFGAHSFTKTHSRSFQIAIAIAKKHHVVYVEPEFRTGYKPGFVELPLNHTMTIVQLKKIKHTYTKSLSLLMRTYKKHAITFVAIDTAWTPYLARFKKKMFVDRQHELVTVPHRKNLVTFGPHQKLGKYVVTNGVDLETFKDASKTIQTCDVGLCWIKRPVIGYIGVLDERIDEVLVGKIATAYPKATIVLVGNTNYRPVVAIAEKHENIFPVGEQPSEKLSLYLQSFDILILPTRATLKYPLVHESLPIYLASGKPVVAMATSQVAKSWQKLIYRAKNPIDFVFQVEKALKESMRSGKRKLRIALAKKMVWNVKKLL